MIYKVLKECKYGVFELLFCDESFKIYNEGSWHINKYRNSFYLRKNNDGKKKCFIDYFSRFLKIYMLTI